MATEDQQPGEEMEVYSSDDDYSIMTEEQWIQYEKEVEESQGFDVGVYYDLSRYGMIKSIDFEDYTEDITYCTELAIRHYNTTENASLVRHKIVKVNYRICGGVAYYITFDARDSNTGDIRTYQSLVYRWAEREKSSVEFTRLKPERTEEKGQDVEEREGKGSMGQNVEENREGKRELEVKDEKEEKKLKCC